jgi:hypothetical protein
MRTAEPRHDEAAPKIDDLGVRADVGADIIGRADHHKPSILDGECLHQRRVVAGGKHLAVDGHEVCGLGAGLAGRTDAQKRHGGEGSNSTAHDVTPVSGRPEVAIPGPFRQRQGAPHHSALRPGARGLAVPVASYYDYWIPGSRSSACGL